MPRGKGYGKSHGSMSRSKGKNAGVTRKRRIKPLTAKRKRAGNVKAKSKKY